MYPEGVRILKLRINGKNVRTAFSKIEFEISGLTLSTPMTLFIKASLKYFVVYPAKFKIITEKILENKFHTH